MTHGGSALSARSVYCSILGRRSNHNVIQALTRRVRLPRFDEMFRKTARNFNPNIATAGNLTVAEAEEIVEAGTLDPDCVHTPGRGFGLHQRLGG
jgi:hypothetical protein